MKSLLFAGILFTGVFGVSCASTNPARAPADLVLAPVTAPKSVGERFRVGVDARIKAGLGFGYFAAIRDGGKTTRLVAGNRSVEPFKLFMERDSLEIGSVSKLFTGILIHLAEAEGRLKLDQRIGDFFPELGRADTGSITVRELGLHTAGLPSYPEGLEPKDRSNPWRDLKKSDVLAALVKFKRPALPEGGARKREYSNWGYLTLGMLLERIYARPYPAILEAKILSPLRMKDTGVDRRTRKRGRAKPAAKVSPAFGLDGQPVAPWDFASFAAAAGGIESNAVDMGRFLEALENPPARKLGEAIRGTFVSGIGWDSEPGNLKPLWKNGMTGGYASFLAFFPETKTALFTATNSPVGPDDLVGFALGVEPTDKLLQRATPPRAATEAELSRLKGKYRNPNPEKDPKLPLRTIEVVESLGRIVARYDFGGAIESALLVPHEKDGVWNVIDGDLNVDALRILENGLRATLTTTDGRTVTFELEKLPAKVENFPATE